jgi:hypothetical protein
MAGHNIPPSEKDVPTRWFDEAENRSAKGCLAAAGLTDQAERFTLADGERHVVHCSGVSGDAGKQSFPLGKVLFEVTNVKED